MRKDIQLEGDTSRLAWTSSDVTGQLQSYNHRITGGGRDNVAIRKDFFKKSEGMSDNSQNTSCFCSSNRGLL